MSHHLITRGQVLLPPQFECFVLRGEQYVVHHSPVLLEGGHVATGREDRAEVDVVTEGPRASEEMLPSSSLLEGDQPLAAVRETQRVGHQFLRGYFALPRQPGAGIVVPLVEEEAQHWRPGLGVEVSRQNDGQDPTSVLHSYPVQFRLIIRK